MGRFSIPNWREKGHAPSRAEHPSTRALAQATSARTHHYHALHIMYIRLWSFQTIYKYRVFFWLWAATGSLISLWCCRIVIPCTAHKVCQVLRFLIPDSKYLDILFFLLFSPRTREKYISSAQFVYFLREVCLDTLQFLNDRIHNYSKIEK